MPTHTQTPNLTAETILRSTTDSAWAAQAAKDLDHTLIDHAHCEKKAAASAFSFVAVYPEDPDLVYALTALATEEIDHFREVYGLLQTRGVPLGRDEGDPYVQQLLALSRQPQKLRKLDRLLASALIEARSCERFRLLAAELERLGDKENAARFSRFANSEAGHAVLFVKLAAREAGWRERLDELAEAEARIVAGLPVAPRIH